MNHRVSNHCHHNNNDDHDDDTTRHDTDHRRTRMAKVHAFIIGHLRDAMPPLIGKKQKQTQLIENLVGVWGEGGLCGEIRL
jgi:hypothetical protein